MRSLFLLLVAGLMLVQCKKTEQITVNNNQSPNYKLIPTIKVENYVNRVFIDLLGREATNIERSEMVALLRSGDLNAAVREKMILKLIDDTTYRDGDSSYRHAYSQRIYDLSKARFLEGASDDEIGQQIGLLDFAITVARLDGDSVTVYSSINAQQQYRKILNSRYEFRKRIKPFNNMCAVMLNNSIYDNINMNSFNYVNASFDDILGRKPSTDEFSRAYDIIDKNIPAQIFGTWAANKTEYSNALTNNSEFYESQIRWIYFVLLQRQATTQEVINLYNAYFTSKDLKDIQLPIMKSDEYAQF